MKGNIISHYRVIDKLGEGGMGIIYKAEDVKLKRIVALKVLLCLLFGMNDIKQAMNAVGVDNAFATAANIMKEIYKSHYISPYDIAILLGHSNKLDEALLWIGKAMQEKDPKVILLNVDPEWYSLGQNKLFLKYVEEAGYKV